MKAIRVVLFLAAGSLLFSQDASNPAEKAPAPVEEALRARAEKFYRAQMDGKYREAFAMVAEDSQDAFLAAPKPQVRKCEIRGINWSENFTKAEVVGNCETDFRFQGAVFPTRGSLNSNWKLVDGQWLWFYVKPDKIPSPFSLSGFVSIPQETTQEAPAPGAAAAGAPAIGVPKLPSPAEVAAMVEKIQQQVKVDKSTIHIRGDQPSKDELHVRNEMPGEVSISIAPVNVPGLKISPAKAVLRANEERTVLFEYQPDGLQPQSPASTSLQVQPTLQTFPIEIVFTDPAAPPAAK